MSRELTNEYRLLLACARKDLSPRHFEEARSAIVAGIDWPLLNYHAEHHSLAPLLYWHLQHNFRLAIPNRQEWRLKLFENNVRNLFLSAALLNILEALRASGIRALAYKGPVLAASIYGDLTLRKMSDLDILIDRDNFRASSAALAELGYQPTYRHSRKQEDARLRSDCECEFSNSDGKVMVDLHWQITPRHLPPQFSFDELWQRRRMVTLGQKSIPTLSVEDTVLVLAIHGGKHLWPRLSWLVEFAETLRLNLDWQALKLSARDAHAERMLALALYLAQDLLEVHLPAEQAAQIRTYEVVQPIAADIRQNIFQPASACEEADRWLTLLRLMDRRVDQICSALRFALSSGPREWESVRLSDSLFGLYPLLRITHLARKAVSPRLPRPLTAPDAEGRMEKR